MQVSCPDGQVHISIYDQFTTCMLDNPEACTVEECCMIPCNTWDGQCPSGTENNQAARIGCGAPRLVCLAQPSLRTQCCSCS